ncbi:MAG: hypothetical protein ACTSPB_00840 [Candidatus Thorarchaeota archaeon]|jgi:hypothetical protein
MSEEPQVMDLREIMKLLEKEGTIPEGFVMIYMLADPDESEEGTQADFFFRAFAQKEELHHKKTVLMWEETPITRHEIAWFGDWEDMADVAEHTEAQIIFNLERFCEEGSLTMMPRMDFMFVNQNAPEEPVAEEDDVF